MSDVMLLTDWEKYEFRTIPEVTRDRSELIKLKVSDWESWVTPKGAVSRRSPLVAAVRHDLDVLDYDNDIERVLGSANALKDLVSHEYPNRDRERVRWAIDRYQCEFPGIDLLYLLLVAPTPDYNPGYHLSEDGTITDVVVQLVCRVSVQIMGSNSLDTYLRVKLERAGDDRVEESFYVLPPGPVTDFDRCRTLVSTQMMLGFCDQEYTQLVIDAEVPGVESGRAGTIREQVAAQLSRLGARRLVFKRGNGIR